MADPEHPEVTTAVIYAAIPLERSNCNSEIQGGKRAGLIYISLPFRYSSVTILRITLSVSFLSVITCYCIKAIAQK